MLAFPAKTYQDTCIPARFAVGFSASGPSMELKVSKRSTDGVPVLDLTGRLVFGDETKVLRAAVKEIIEHGDSSMVLNLSDLAYVDSGGIGTLVGLYTSARAAGGDLKLACPN